MHFLFKKMKKNLEKAETDFSSSKVRERSRNKQASKQINKTHKRMAINNKQTSKQQTQQKWMNDNKKHHKKVILKKSSLLLGREIK